MRKSHTAVLVALGLVVLLIGGLAVLARLVAGPALELSGERASRSYDFTGFDGVETSGQWQVTIERGDAWSVAVEAPLELLDNLEVELDGDELSLGYEGGWCPGCFRDENVVEATITMPVLVSLEVSGSSQLSFSGFEGDALSVDVSGAVELRGAAGRFDTLTLDLSGAGDVDLSEVPTTNVELDVSGAGNVELRMAGGRLTGDMSGAANLEYSGPVSEESVEQSGFVNVRRRN
jgi:Putative auto-transporter adhesin, head GIN domain